MFPIELESHDVEVSPTLGVSRCSRPSPRVLATGVLNESVKMLLDDEPGEKGANRGCYAKPRHGKGEARGRRRREKAAVATRSHEAKALPVVPALGDKIPSEGGNACLIILRA